ncbi:conserved hypothetical protein [Symbiobacterium thermophilum IAM 14863]|uniref:DUF456 domain-containing protein n=2 Tax=Symbiobacterium thermophilum TaxID=2734 RepID=Q67NM1_SYMTH|nr:conserved hypothetical protein [Symbiobacterium thermophilum IAM 14863]
MMGWQWIAFAIAVVVMLAGVVGTLIPALPGLPIVFLAMLGYAVVDGFRDITPGFLAVALLVVAATQVAEHYARAWGAKRFGAGRAGAWGAVIGSIVGLFFMPLGLLLGPFLGALLFELVAGRSGSEAVKAGFGGLVGVLGSVVVNVVVALGLTVAFVAKVLI